MGSVSLITLQLSTVPMSFTISDDNVHILLRPSDGGCVYVVKGWLSDTKAKKLFDLISNDVPNPDPSQDLIWSQPIIKVFGYHPTPRLIASVSDKSRGNFTANHSYSGITLESQNWDDAEKGSALRAIRHIRNKIMRENLYIFSDHLTVDTHPQVVELRDTKNDDLNSCLLNRYRDGNDYIGAHSDKELRGEHATVVTLSLGSPRNFYFIKKSGGGIFKRIVLEPGDLCVMYSPSTQQNFTHTVPKQAGVGERISLTFRQLR